MDFKNRYRLKLIMKPLIIDLKVGNIESLKSAINFLGVEVEISNNKEAIDLSSHIILPGVGAFDSMSDEIRKNNLDEVIKENILKKKKPFLGICVGMQILFKSSEEGKKLGLGLFNNTVKKLEISKNSTFKIPNVGFSKIFDFKSEGLFNSLENPFFYFTHSYASEVFNEKNLNSAICQHEKNFLAGFQKQNICAVQFHPEKSQSYGLQILSNFFEHIN